MEPRLLTAQEAATWLGIKLDTLYAYVSRGRLHSVAVPGTRERHYRPEDIEAFRAARGSLRELRDTGADALMPVIDSAICLIKDGRLYYRGHDAVRLSDSATLEDIADLLWGTRDRQMRTHSAPASARVAPSAGVRGRSKELTARGFGIIERCQISLATLAAGDLAKSDLAPAAVARTGHSILQELVGCVAEMPSAPIPAHRRLARHWRLDEAGADLLRRCLVLLADHELNASTFVARCVASTGATPFAVVSAALAALSGPRHGGGAGRVEAIFDELKATGDPMVEMAARLARGTALPGIGHPLYPEGDPRAVAILYAVSAIVPQVRQFVGWRPNVDFALAAATTALGLPLGSALGLFVVGRTVGWIAHAIEQYESGALIRPHARYTGPRPAPTPGERHSE
jgi:citrate synthase